MSEDSSPIRPVCDNDICIDTGEEHQAEEEEEAERPAEAERRI